MNSLCTIPFKGEEKGHICEDCYIQVERLHRKRQNRQTSPSTLAKTATLTSVARALASSKYKTAFRLILSRGRLARKAFSAVVEGVVRGEMRQYLRTNKFPGPVLEGKGLENFTWSDVVNDVETAAPTLVSAIRGSMPKMETMNEKQRFVNLLESNVSTTEIKHECTVHVYCLTEISIRT